MSVSTTTSIAIVDDSDIVRYRVKYLLSSIPEFEISFEASDGQECIDKMMGGDSNPDLIILDIEMPVLSGFETAELLKSRWPSTKIIAYSMCDNCEVVKHIIHCGADIFLHKNTPPDKMIETINDLVNN